MAIRDIVQAAAGASGDATYIEDVFSTYLYTGNGSTQTITNGIDLAGEGGLVWIKARSVAESNQLVDTVRGNTKYIVSNNTDSEDTTSTRVTAFNANGFSLGTHSIVNGNGVTFASWTFREQPKFFDIVTYTGTGVARTISHNLGSIPGCIIVKRINGSRPWAVYHRGLSSATNSYIQLNSIDSQLSSSTIWNSTAPTSTVFSLGANTNVNNFGDTYIAYLFAHDAGGFGLSGNDNVISCGSYTGAGTSGVEVNVGFEPQWLLIKGTTITTSWALLDNMRGIATNGEDKFLYTNAGVAESSTVGVELTSTGFRSATTNGSVNEPSNTYIYIAIRRGPMKTPESGTEVFLPQLVNTSAPAYRASFTIDSVLSMQRTGGSHYIGSRLTGTGIMATNNTNAESSYAPETWDYQTSALNYSSLPIYEVGQCFRRAPSFFDVVCYTGTGVTGNVINHNLGIVPELIIIKDRSVTSSWAVAFSFTSSGYLTNRLEQTAQAFSRTYTSANEFTTQPTTTSFTVGSASIDNRASSNFVAYLFASCPNVSKVGSYTGTGTTQQINCGFTGGARFVLIKRTDSTGNWYVWDSARGIVAGNDPYLLLNSNAVEVTNTDYIDTFASGFEITSTAPAEINANGGSYIFLAIA